MMDNAWLIQLRIAFIAFRLLFLCIAANSSGCAIQLFFCNVPFEEAHQNKSCLFQNFFAFAAVSRNRLNFLLKTSQHLGRSTIFRKKRSQLQCCQLEAIGRRGRAQHVCNICDCCIHRLIEKKRIRSCLCLLLVSLSLQHIPFPLDACCLLLNRSNLLLFLCDSTHQVHKSFYCLLRNV